MTKRDYIVLANALKNARPLFGSTVNIRTIKYGQWQQDVAHITQALQANDSRFNAELFLKACGVNQV